MRRPMMPSPPTSNGRLCANAEWIVLSSPNSCKTSLGIVNCLSCVQFAGGMVKSPVELDVEPRSVKWPGVQLPVP